VSQVQLDDPDDPQRARYTPIFWLLSPGPVAGYWCATAISATAR